MQCIKAVVCLLLASADAAAVIGIDLGARFLKVGVIQPGTGIELVLNEATQRKSSSAAGFSSQGERVYGNEAQNMIGKVPSQIFIMSKLLLGQTLDSEAIADFKKYLYPYAFEKDEATESAILRYNANATYRAEEMVAFVLTYAKQIAEGHAGSQVKDCVITVPPFFGHLERAALLNAATIAGLNVLSLLHESTAFAFKYGFDKESEFGPEPTNVVFYDLGASSYKVSIVSFSSVVGKKNKTQGSMAIKGLGWDERLGGKDFDDIVLNMLASEFNEKVLKGKEDVRDAPKAVGKLRKEAERCKDILSANQKYQVGIEALYDDRDLRTTLSRETFTAEAEKRGLWQRLVPPLEQALLQANLTKDQIHRVEVVGGATRIPQVKQAAMEFFGGRFAKQLDGALNGDEAAAFGATLYAAKLSTSFRLREFGIADMYPHATSVKITGGDEGKDEEEDGEESKKGKDKLLFKANTKMPHKKLITMTRTNDLIATLSLGDASLGEDLSPIYTFNISGVSAAYARLLKDEARTVLGKPKVSVTFALSSSGLIDVAKAEMALEMLEKYEDFELVPDDNATDAAEALEANSTAADDATSNDTATAKNATAMKKVKVEKERKRMHYTTLKVAKQVLGACLPISKEVVTQCIDRNIALLKAENLRKINAEAKNTLEAFVIDTRDKLGEESVELVSKEEERAGLFEKLNEVEEWLYEDGMSLEASAYQKRQKELQKETAPIFERFAELEARPKAVATARDAINWTMTILETWATERPEVTVEERTKVSDMCANFTTWLEQVEEEQAALPPTSPPAFLSSNVVAKLEPIELEVRKLIKKPKPKPKPIKKNATNTNATDETNSTADAKPADGEKAEEKVVDEEVGGEKNASDEGGLEEELPPHDEL